MKKRLLSIILALVMLVGLIPMSVIPVSAATDCTLPYSFDFETDLLAEGWVTIDFDGDGHDWKTGTQRGIDYAIDGFGGAGYCALSQSYDNHDGSFEADNWLFSPALQIPEGGAKISWYEQSQDANWPDSYEVYVREKEKENNYDCDTTKMTKLYGGTAANPWTQKTVELSAADYGGKTVYIAFRHYCTDCYFFEIDNFAAEALEAPATKYGVWVNGVEFTSANATTGITCGDGKATLELPANTGDPYVITLDNATITKTYNDNNYLYSVLAGADLKIVLKGTSTITTTAGEDSSAIGCIKNDGSGTRFDLTIESTLGGNLTIDHKGNLNGIVADTAEFAGEIFVTAGVKRVLSAPNGATLGENYKWSGSAEAVTKAEATGAIVAEEGTVRVSGSNAKTLVVEPTAKYGVWANGIEFTSANATTGIKCGDGKATLGLPANTGDPYVITLDGATITEKYSGAGIYASNKKIDIVLNGTNKIELADTTSEDSNSIGIDLGTTNNAVLSVKGGSSDKLDISAGAVKSGKKSYAVQCKNLSVDAFVSFAGATRATAISTSATTTDKYAFRGALTADTADKDLLETEFKANSGICVKDASAATKLVKSVKTADVHMFLYKNGTTNAVVNGKVVANPAAGYDFDFTTIDYKDHFDVAGKEYVFHGWYNDGGWNTYVAGGTPDPLSVAKPNDWYNIKGVINSMETVKVYAVKDGDKDTATEIGSFKAEYGSNLYDFLNEKLSVDAPYHYTWDNKYNNMDWFGHAFDTTKKVEGWTNVYVNFVPDTFPCHVVIYKNFDYTKPFKDVALTDVKQDQVITLADIDINDYFASTYGFVFNGWYNDGQWNAFMTNGSADGLETITVNGWTNIVCNVVEKQKVQVVLYKNGNYTTPYKTVSLDPVVLGETIDLTALDVEDYITAGDFANGYEFDGWFNDGAWSNYTADKTKNTGLDSVKVNGWTNIKGAIYSYENVVVKGVKNGDKDNAETIYSGTALYGTNLADFLDENANISAPTGYSWDGAYMNWDWYGHEFDDNKTVEGWTNVYVDFTPNQYNITYVLNDGSSVAPATNTNVTTYTVEDVVTLADATRKGYTFKGWYDNADFTGTAVTTFGTGVIGDKTFYAKWEVINYTITYVLNDGNSVSPATNTNVTTYTVEDVVTLADATRKGYTFKGWYDNADFTGSKVTTFGNDVIGDKTFYANWEVIVYNITYDLNYDVKTQSVPSNNNSNVKKYTVEDNVTFYNPYRRGYTFLKWTENGSKTTGFNAGTIGNKTIVANWSLNVYKVTYVLNGGLNDGNNVTTYTVEDGAHRINPARWIGMSFGGWFTNAKMTADSYFDCIERASDGDIVLYAKWMNLAHYLPNRDLVLAPVAPIAPIEETADEPTAEPAEEPTEVVTPSEWAAEEVKAAVENGLVPEELCDKYTDGITRGELAKMLKKLLDAVYGKEAETADAKFGDTDDADVLYAANLGIIKGYETEDGFDFKPENTLKRSEITAIVNRVATLCGVETAGYEEEVKFEDTVDHWCGTELGWPVHAEIIKGTSEKTFSPENTLTREQAIMIVYRTFNALKPVEAAADAE